MAGRVTQLPIEVIQNVSGRNARSTQETIEVVQNVSARQARDSQYVVEVFWHKKPMITAFTPDHGTIGRTVTITGTDFGAVQGDGTVTFNGVTATIVSWSDTEIVAKVPAGAKTGLVVVCDTDSICSDGELFTIDSPGTLSVPPTFTPFAGGLRDGGIVGNPPVVG